MPRAVPVASAATDVQALTGGATLVAMTVTASVATVVYVRDGTSAAAPIVATARLGAAGTVHVPVPATDIGTGLFVDRDGTNAAELVLYVM